LRPFVGVLAWTWVSFMNPHRLSWGVARTFPVALVVALATLAGVVLSGEPKQLPRNPGTRLLFALWACLSISTALALHSDTALEAWILRSKILLMAILTMTLLKDRERLRWLCIVTALSVGFFGLKGGIFTIITGAQYQVLGPEDTFLGDNTSLALALTMVLPILFYLTRDVNQKPLRWLLWATFVFSIPAIIGTYSRGGLLGLAAVAMTMFAKGGRKLFGVVLLTAATVAVITLAPQKWSQRMETIGHYQSEASAMARIHAWTLAWRLALARPIFGWGPQAMDDKKLYDTYYPESPGRDDVHNSYLQLLAECGFVTFAVFAALLGWCLLHLRRLSALFRESPEHTWVATYADMLQVSLIGYVVSAAFLEMAFFDLLYHIVASSIALVQLAAGLEVKSAVPLRRAAHVPLAPVPRATTAVSAG